MRRIVWCVSSRCPMSCSYCYHSFKNVSPTNEMSIDMIQNVITEIDDCGIRNVTISGGEPFYRRDIFEILQMLKKQGLIAKLYSNGILITRQMCRKIASTGIGQIVISLDCLEPSINNSTRGQTESALRGLNSLLELPNRNFRLSIHTVLTQLNIDCIEQLLSFCEENELDDWAFDMVVLSRNSPLYDRLSVGALKHSQKLDYFDKLEQAIESFKYRIKVPCIEYTVILSKYLLEGYVPKGPCPAGKDSVVLSPNGDVFPCFSRVDCNLGNVETNKMEDILVEGMLFHEENIDLACFGIQCFCAARSTKFDNRGWIYEKRNV